MKLTPRQRAGEVLFGELGYEPHHPDHKFLHPGTHELITFNALVARYEDADDAASHD
jgi:hypothetical protein